MSSLYERLGGAQALDAVVHAFYDRVLADARISEFFDGIDMKRQAAKQKAFLAMVTGGPTKYEGKDMRSAHEHFELEDEHFDAVVANLGATLEAFHVPDEEIAECAAIAESVRDEVLNRKPAAH